MTDVIFTAYGFHYFCKYDKIPSMKKIILLLLISTSVFAELTEVIHSSATTYFEHRTFSHSVQKEDGNVYGVGADIHYNASEYKFVYEYGDTNTRQPPLKEDLKTQKLFLRYMYSFNDVVTMNMNYIKILDDNIAITDNGTVYGAGVTYRPAKKIALNLTQYYTDYEDFNVYQSDLKLEYKTKIDEVKLKISSITKYINIDEEHANVFTKNAQDDYLTTGLMLHMNYHTYHAGAGVYFGKRVFAIMNDGFKIQHHAMEFDRTYAVGMGKKISDVMLRLQYIYQRATELPMQNEGVEVSNIRLIANYRF
jgi:hypothetical protein